MIIANGNNYLTVTEVIERTMLSKNTIYQRHKSYGWRPMKYGRNILFDESDIQSWVNTRVIEKSTIK